MRKLEGRDPEALQVVNSALWAAWGDALGFMTELVKGPRDVAERTGGQSYVEDVLPWRRRVGGRFGPTVELPAGAYSDDTQLRLATSRAIRGDGTFDVEAFSKVELPVFLSYGLGVGRGTREAAKNLGRRDVRWSSNFFEPSNGSPYVNGGGNGAAMRIQPHVWATRRRKSEALLLPVLINTITTHGHPRALVGAAFHALSLGTALRNQRIPGPEQWGSMMDFLRGLPELVRRDKVLGGRWLPLWEQRSSMRFDDGIARTVAEGQNALRLASKVVSSSGSRYGDLVAVLNATDPRTRGSGLTSSVLALCAASKFENDPVSGIREVSNVLGSDTDTIATMAGALLGSVSKESPPSLPMDADYIAAEAYRLWQVSTGWVADSFAYPDRLSWRAPETQGDALGHLNGDLAIYGLGPVVPVSEEYPGTGREQAIWQWMELAFGQRVLIKRRVNPRPLPADAGPVVRRLEEQSLDLLEPLDAKPSIVDEAVDSVVSQGFSPAAIGHAYLTLESQTRDAELLAEFARKLAYAIARVG